MRLMTIGGLLLCCMLATAAQAKVYKWVDAQGRVHYSSQPPPNAAASEVRIAPTPPSAQNAAPPQPDQGIAEQPVDATAAPRSAAADDAARAEAFRRNCEIARQNLRILEDPTNRRFTEDGKDPIYYSDEQRQAKIAEAKELEAEFCGGADTN